MPDESWIPFLQWALPQLRLRWQGFRKVRRRVCKGLASRLRQLNLADPLAYRAYLQEHPDEWAVLDGLCRVVISRFYRDRLLFVRLEEEVLPALAAGIRYRQQGWLRIWSAGCASGEEPYSVAILWLLRLQALYPEITLDLLATDVDQELLRRADAACYTPSSVKNLPLAWRNEVFVKNGDHYCLRPAYRDPVRFEEHDIRTPAPSGAPFHLILCRNLVFTYFDRDLQSTCLENLRNSLLPGGYLIIGVHEQLPEPPGFVSVSSRLGIYRKNGA